MGAAWGLREAQESDTSEKRQSVWWKRTVGATHLSLLQSLVPFLDSWGSAALHPGGNVSAYRRIGVSAYRRIGVCKASSAS
jgi:hypothetical protein